MAEAREYLTTTPLTSPTTLGATWGWRSVRDKRGKTHRRDLLLDGLACSPSVSIHNDRYEAVMVSRTAPEDRCRRCFPPPTEDDGRAEE